MWNGTPLPLPLELPLKSKEKIGDHQVCDTQDGDQTWFWSKKKKCSLGGHLGELHHQPHSPAHHLAHSGVRVRFVESPPQNQSWTQKIIASGCKKKGLGLFALKTLACRMESSNPKDFFLSWKIWVWWNQRIWEKMLMLKVVFVLRLFWVWELFFPLGAQISFLLLSIVILAILLHLRRWFLPCLIVGRFPPSFYELCDVMGGGGRRILKAKKTRFSEKNTFCFEFFENLFLLTSFFFFLFLKTGGVFAFSIQIVSKRPKEIYCRCPSANWNQVEQFPFFSGKHSSLLLFSWMVMWAGSVGVVWVFDEDGFIAFIIVLTLFVKETEFILLYPPCIFFRLVLWLVSVIVFLL